jgi:hypothetical protein
MVALGHQIHVWMHPDARDRIAFIGEAIRQEKQGNKQSLITVVTSIPQREDNATGA